MIIEGYWHPGETASSKPEVAKVNMASWSPVPASRKGAKVFFIPGHTTGHVAYLFDNNLFCGDTLFTAGCGRLFEGTPEQMHGSLKKLMSLPDNTKVYCGHEYTEANLRFAMTVEGKNPKLARRGVQGLAPAAPRRFRRRWKKRNKPIRFCAGTQIKPINPPCPMIGFGFRGSAKNERRVNHRAPHPVLFVPAGLFAN
jgi:glyoxylase-like metal-dependent hydrolase (beta-lactamase superfamily II)